MKSVTELMQLLRRETPLIYRQLELPLGGTKLHREQTRTLMELRKIRLHLAAA